MREFSASCRFVGAPDFVLQWAATVLCRNGFAVTDRQASTISLRGPGMRSTSQNPLLGVSEIRLKVNGDTLLAEAQLGAAERMQRFVSRFPFQLCAGLTLVFATLMGWLFGRAFGIGFGVPFAPGWSWLMFALPIGLTPAVPWLFISPAMSRGIRLRTEEAVTTLVNNAAVITEPK